MTKTRLVLASLRYHARAHLGVVLGAAVGAAALIGALLVGDSVKASLRDMALARLGTIELALPGYDRLLRSELAADLRANLERPVAAVLTVPATAARGDGEARVNNAVVLGVDGSFWALAHQPPNLPADWEQGVVLNHTAARQLRVGPGDEILLRLQKPSALSREAPVSSQSDLSVALRLPVTAVVNDAGLGRFSLQANQVPPFNAFVSLELLQGRVEQTNRANLFLVATTNPNDPPTAEEKLDAADAQAILRRVWKLADAGLELVPITNLSGMELRSDRVFLDPPVSVAAHAAAPEQARDVTTYFVNELTIAPASTPYSMVAGLDPAYLPAEMADDEILLHPWLVEDLSASPGQVLRLSYYVLGAARRLEVRTAEFRVRGAAPTNGIFADRQLMPEFPGVAEAESSQDWEAGFPIDFGKIRPKDEEYWKVYRGTPKAFITLAAAQRLWSNRFGDVTAVRFEGTNDQGAALPEKILGGLDPASLNLQFQPVRQEALRASSESFDFGQLFLGFSFFLIVAALVLMALLFQFGVEQRTRELGTLLAVGFTPRQVRRLIWWEGTALAAVGTLIGLAGAVLYARAMLYGLRTIWRGATGTSDLAYHATGQSLVIGCVASVLIAMLTMALVLRKHVRRPARELLEEGAVDLPQERGKRRRVAWPLGLVTALAAIALTIWMLSRGSAVSPPAFFGAGSLLLIAGLSFVAVALSALDRSAAAERPSIPGMGLRNATRRRRRSLATVILLACGSFIVVAVGANKLEAGRDAHERSSGTGGFAFIGQTSLPVVHDLNSADGRDFFGLESNELAGVSFVPFRVRDGDDASCLNLNRAQRPRLLGVNPTLLEQRKAFTFAAVAPGLAADQRWRLLDSSGGDESIAAVGDQASIQWAMKLKLGDAVQYVDERGQPFSAMLAGGLANSILQGNLLIDEAEFVRRFPGEAGYRMFLIDCPVERREEVAARLSRALQDVGLELIPATDRLAAFNAVQNTYLNTFQILGGLGLLLGSAGLGVVVLRNVLERRSELALLQAVGFRKRTLRSLVLWEHGGLLCAGIVVGLAAALVAVLPVLLTPGARLQYLSLGATLAGVVLSGLLWTALATAVAVRGRLLEALRNE